MCGRPILFHWAFWWSFATIKPITVSEREGYEKDQVIQGHRDLLTSPHWRSQIAPLKGHD